MTRFSPVQRANRSDAVSAWMIFFCRSGLVLLALAAFYLFGLLTPKALHRAAIFSLLINAALVGTLMAWGQRRLASVVWMGFASIILASVAVKGFLFSMYGMTPKDTLVIDAIAGTTPGEVSQFLAQYWRTLAAVASLWLASVALVVGFEKLQAGRPLAAARRPWVLAARTVCTLMLMTFAGMHANRTVANENPLVYWPRQGIEYGEQQERLVAIRAMMQEQTVDLSDDPVFYRGPQANTVVLVIGESINRYNWSLYGYGRQTTPELDRMRDELVVFRDVLSADAATAQSLLKMLTPATIEHPDLWSKSPSLLAIAKRAGYEVHWLSNQERSDGWIQLLAGQADEQVFVNHGAGRSITSLDEKLIPEFEKTLADPSPRKFIIVHMQGAHLRYDLRYPGMFAKFGNQEDEVSRAMQQAARPSWLRQVRNEYDNAILYGDHVLASLLTLAEKYVGQQPAQLLYVSDHGQEVGHNRDFAGHSSLDASGYEIPMFLWSGKTQHAAFQQRDLYESRAYQADRLDNTLLSLLQIETDYYRAQDDMLSPRFVPVTDRQVAGKAYERRPLGHLQR